MRELLNKNLPVWGNAELKNTHVRSFRGDLEKQSSVPQSLLEPLVRLLGSWRFSEPWSERVQWPGQDNDFRVKEWFLARPTWVDIFLIGFCCCCFSCIQILSKPSCKTTVFLSPSVAWGPTPGRPWGNPFPLNVVKCGGRLAVGRAFCC